MSLTIPVIDLHHAENADTKPTLLHELRTALLEVGFIYLKNYDIPVNTVTSIQDLLPTLFDEPEAHKEEWSSIKLPHFLV